MPSSRRCADGLPHGDAALRVEAGAGLVEEEDLGAVGDGAGDLDALGEASGELGWVGAGALGEVELVEQLLGALAGFCAGEAEVEAVEVDVFEDGAGAVERVVLGHDADASGGRVAGAATTSMPAMRTRPEVGRARVVQMLMVVVLPAPLGPSRPKSSPSRTLRSMPSTATTRCLPS